MRKQIIAHCPYVSCGKIIFKEARIEFADTANVLEMKTLCPHCRGMVKIRIGVNIETSATREL